MDIAGALAKALRLVQSGQTEAAAALLTEILVGNPGEPDALQLLGMIARSAKDDERAVALFRRSLNARPRQPHVFNNLGNALLDLDRVDDAIEAYRAAIEIDPLYADALTNLGLAHLAAGDPAAAQRVLNRAVEVDANNAKALSALGRALRASDRLDEAIGAFHRSLVLRPGHVSTLNNLAVALRLTGDPAQAAAILEHCVAAHPGSAEIRYNLGHCRYDLGRHDEAVADYRAAIAIDPTNRDAHDSLSRLRWQLGDTANHLESYVTTLRQFSDNAGLLTDLANRLNLSGDIATSATLLDSAIARGVDSAEIRHRLGQARWAGGDFDAALHHYSQAIQMENAGSQCRLELARSLIILKRYDDALSSLDPIFETSPHNQQAIAYQSLAWRLIADARAPRVNDYERFVTSSILHPPADFGDIATFNRRLETVLAALHDADQHPLEQTLRGGTQTMGDLFQRQAPEIKAVEAMIAAAVSAYIKALPDDGSHVFLKRKTASFRYAGSWSVRLRSQGFHLNHVHSEGWISSCYYVGLPPAVESSADRQGWIKFGETGFLNDDREQTALCIKPEVGKLILFPSYMFHGTIPFEDTQPRTTIAFDVVPG